MLYKFPEEESFDKKALLQNEKSGINQFLLENNAKQCGQIIDFLNSSAPILLVNGFLGTGKTQVVNHALSFLSKDTICLKYNCFETTILDDILLSFFDDFKKLIAQNTITLPKAKSENFTQKINGYFQSINKPVVIVLNSYEEILKTNKPEILDFIFHLCSLGKVKIILISRVFTIEEFEKVKFERVSVLALEKSLFEKYLRSEGFKQIGPFSDELYKHTRGYFFYTALAVKIMQNRNLSLIDFLGGFGKSFLSFNDFLLREALSFVDPVSGHLFRFLTIMRHPVSVRLLFTLHLYDEERLKFFTDNLIITRDGGDIYLQDYYKEIAENSIPENVRIKLHQGCVDLYNTQLPLKPLERDLMISRQTMRKEIEYHGIFLPKKPILNRQADAPAENKENNSTTKPLPEHTAQEEPQTMQDKDTQLQNMSFIFDNDEHDILGKIADSIKNFISFSDEKSKQSEEDEKLSLAELVTLANKEELQYNYKRVISLYQRALTMKSDDDFYMYLPKIYTGIAGAYLKISDWFNAIKYFEDALEFFDSTGDMFKANETKLEIANIYYNTFKREKAEELLEEILQSAYLTEELKIKTLLALSNIKEDNYNYLKTALSAADTGVDKKVLAELYYKYALACEDKDLTDEAVKFYKMCVNLDLNPKHNPHLSAALSNLGSIYDEHNSPEIADKYYQESLKIDEIGSNLNGIYISSIKLAELNSKKSPEKAIMYFEKAKTCAKELNEPFYMATSAVLFGDFRYARKEFDEALKNYIYAYEKAKGNLSKDNVDKIRMRFSDIKARLGEETFNKLAKEIVNAK